MPLRCCAMKCRGRSREEEKQQQQQAAVVASAAVPRRGRWFDGEHQPPAASSSAVAGRAGWRLRSCAAAAIADCVALGCCPCAVVALLGIALVRAPLAVGRRLRRRRLSLLRRKRVRDVAASAKGAKAAGAAPGAGSGTLLDTADEHATVGAATAPVHHHHQQQQAEAEELAWLEELYRVGHWGFGRVSFSGSAGKTP
ncbi:uncharacterized protein LOC8064296 [Sorghum bicolor]|uniref:Uncharacterized protein n=1 Tax=Sorghum bicolor TaxID=4558 RepID=C5YVW1_SORBI|nr:uncharacterized protein LOC8064296 [Sorghum bicolor]EES18692.2 hypothetical protein SORBI_3009G236600 [Sorghum bicolor]|eukprot:XP_002440275.2 uncharacterized protein LOC8064296 [Sorghum bicolor]